MSSPFPSSSWWDSSSYYYPSSSYYYSSWYYSSYYSSYSYQSSYYNPEEDYYQPDVNLTGRDWFNNYNSTDTSVASYQTLTLLMAQMDADKRREMGHQLIDFVQECSWAGKGCSPLNFTAMNSRYYGNCYSFNTKGKVLKSSKSGPLYGLVLTLNIEQHEYIQELSPAAGVRVLLHNQALQPFPEDDGFDISPGQKTSVALRLSKFHRLPYPYSNCTDGQAQAPYLMYRKLYSVAACLRSCQQLKTLNECSCADPGLPIPVNKTVCNSTEEKTCMRKVEGWIEYGVSHCDCPQPCSERLYISSISTSDWPAKSYERTLQAQFAARDPHLKTVFSTYNNTVKENFLKLEVYFQDLTQEHYEELPAYGIENLLGDIGGQLGLWIGMSIITIIEVIEVLAMTAKYFMSRSSQVHSSNEPPKPSSASTTSTTDSWKGFGYHKDQVNEKRPMTPVD